MNLNKTKYLGSSRNAKFSVIKMNFKYKVIHFTDVQHDLTDSHVDTFL